MPINFTVVSFAIDNTRSVHEDTDYVGVAITQNKKEVAPQTKRIGNVNNGTHAVNMTVSVPSEYTTADTFVFSYLVINHGGGKTQDVLDHCASAMTQPALTTFNAAQAVIVSVNGVQLPTSLSTDLRAADNINALWNPIKVAFKQLSSDHCDGPVALDSFSFTGAALNEMILTSQANPFSIIYLGIDSAVGCGSNSHYSVQWRVSVS
ncbi:hypothetical protein P8936_17965 [Edaphobacter paludis]|uniref:Inclusion body protein n=1 Tax=Edaphobacter paludis TaxID=3035702 RepID=A0AAU7CZM8_9BACT